MDETTTVLPEPEVKQRLTIQFRVTAEEYAQIEALADAAHLKIGTYINHAILSNNAPKQPENGAK